MKKYILKTGVLALGILTASVSQAQKTDTTRSVDITSSFRPELKEPAKLNFNATPPTADTTRPRLQYDIPNPNLMFAYQPGSLKPLALTVDTSVAFDNNNYIKAGFGSLKTPYLQAGFSFGDGNAAGLNIYARHVSSQGKREFQDFTQTQVRASGFYKTASNLEITGGLGMRQDRTYKYGYVPETLSFPDDSIRQRFSTISLNAGLRNLEETGFGMNYSPNLKIDIFSDHLKNSESNTVLDLPIEKTIGQDFTVNLGLRFDLTRLSLDKASAINNTMWWLAPSVVYKNTRFRFQGGIRPTWDNSTFKMFPNILAEIGTDDSRFTFQAGWTGYVRKTTFQYLASQNPWLWAPGELRNTWIEERFAGFKGSVGDHFSYGAKVGFNRLNNQPLFVNDTVAGTDGKSFNVVYADRINVLNLGGELGYTVEEKFSVTAALSFNQFTGLQGQQKAWGSMNLRIIKDLWLKTDLFAWSGPRYLRANGSDGKLSGAFDLNAGLEFRVTKNINVWTQFNNILNKEYQRWNQYRVYGFNFVGGIVFSFDQKN